MLKNTLFIMSILAVGLGVAASASALSVSPGDLIKGPGDTVYYYAQDGMRHVFPNLKTYQTWYPDFSSVKPIPLAELQSIQLGGKNVTYKPGVRMVKITTDPKVYAVAANGTLRWVQTEALAIALYGADWNSKIDDVSDAYFINYKVGSPITSTGDFSPSAETAAATSVDADLKTVAPVTPPTTPTTPTSTTPTATSTSNLTFTASKSEIQAGDVVTLIAQAQDPNGILKIELFFGGELVTTCYSQSCSGDAAVPTSGTLTSYVAEGRVTTVSQQVSSKSITLPVKADGLNKISVRVDRTQITPEMAYAVTAEVDSSVALQRIDLYVDDQIINSCVEGERLCSWSDFFEDSTVGSIHPVKATVSDNLGRVYTSQILEILVATTDAPRVVVTPAKSSIFKGETLEVTVTATDDNGISSIDLMKDGTVIKHCVGAQPCTALTGPWNNAGTLYFTGRAYDTLNAIGSGTSSAVTVAVQQ